MVRFAAPGETVFLEIAGLADSSPDYAYRASNGKLIKANDRRYALTMEDEDAVIYVAWLYNVKVQNGEGDGRYACGDAAPIKAEVPPDGWVFDRWEIVYGNASLDDSNAEETTLTLNSGSVIVKAFYTHMEAIHTPVFEPAAGVYGSPQNVEISCKTDGAEMYYTTDGSTPTASSAKYTGAITVDKTTTIKAIAIKSGMKDSSVATGAYVIKSAAVITKNPEIVTGLQFNGWPQELIKKGEAEGGVLLYALGNEDEATEPYLTAIPTGRNAGTYNVWYYVKGDSTHNDSDRKLLGSVTISKSDITPEELTGGAKYGSDGIVDISALIEDGGTVKKDGTTVSDTDDVLYTNPILSEDNKLTFSFKDDKSKCGKTAAVTVPVTGIANYNDYNITVKLKVCEKDVPLLEAENIDTVYDAKEVSNNSIKGTARLYGDEISGTWTFKEETGRKDGRDSGAKVVIFVPDDKENYESVETVIRFNISSAEATVKAEDKKKNVGEEDPELTAKVTGLKGDDKIGYSLFRETGETGGTYEIFPIGAAEQGNYKVTYVSGVFTILADSEEENNKEENNKEEKKKEEEKKEEEKKEENNKEENNKEENNEEEKGKGRG